MIDALATAASTVAAISPWLTEIARGAADRIGEAATNSLLAWLRTKTTGRARDALAGLERQPDSADNQADLRKQLAHLLEQDPALLAELRALLSAGGDRMEQHVTGANAKGVQIKGGGNTVTL
ncbi:MAG: hypothetical protein HIU82_20910 [Proteobacteria bacterium]|nr:hypothetical protein [Pseudomonadota bacterium]